MLPIYFISYIFIYFMLEFNSGINQIEKTIKDKKKKKKEGPTHMSGQSSKISCVLVLKNPSMWLRLRV